MEVARSIWQSLLNGGWLKLELWDNAVESYLVSLLIFFLVWLGLKSLHRFTLGRLLRNKDAFKAPTLFQVVMDLLSRISPLVFAIFAVYIATRRLNVNPTVDGTLQFLTLLALTLQIIRIASDTITFMVEKSNLLSGKEADLSTRNSAHNLATILKAVLWIVGFLFLLDNLGIDVTTFIAGLGIGGIAIALAAQAILGDAFSSFAIALDKPFEVGDFLIVGELMGTVEYVGLKTTRIRSLGGEMLIFRNTDLTSSRIQNFKRMYQRRINFAFGVAYDTPIELLKKIPKLVEDAIVSTNNTKFDRAHFYEYGEYALKFDVVYFCLSPDFNEYMDIQQEINFKLHEALSERAIKFAIPTQIVQIPKEPM